MQSVKGNNNNKIYLCEIRLQSHMNIYYVSIYACARAYSWLAMTLYKCHVAHRFANKCNYRKFTWHLLRIYSWRLTYFAQRTYAKFRKSSNLLLTHFRGLMTPALTLCFYVVKAVCIVLGFYCFFFFFDKIKTCSLAIVFNYLSVNPRACQDLH